MKSIAVMISCAQRASTERARSLQSLNEAGVIVLIQESPCNPAGPALNKHAAFHAIRSAYEISSRVLFLEDDITVKPDLTLFLSMAEDLGRITTFCVLRDRLYLQDPYGDLTARLVPLNPSQVPLDRRTDGRGGFYGTQAIYLPPHVTSAVLAHQSDFVREDGSPLTDEEAGDGFDFWLKRHAAWLGGIFAAFPNPVQHRNPAKMKSVTRGRPAKDEPGKHRSGSFDLEAAWPT